VLYHTELDLPYISGFDLHHQTCIHVGRMDGSLPSLVSGSYVALQCIFTFVADTWCTVSSFPSTHSGAWTISCGEIHALSLARKITRRLS
jgi:hypothetical protein